MITGIGTDLVEIARLSQALVRTPTLRERLFTPAEAGLPDESLAARFAAKEALAKALGSPGGLSWHDAEVVTATTGEPSFALKGGVAELVGGRPVHLSLAHDGGMALAFVVLGGAADPR